MVWAIRFEQFGGPEVLKYQQVDVGEPKAGEARVAHRAIGLNFIDVYHRTGLYPMTLPSGLGGEGGVDLHETVDASRAAGRLSGVVATAGRLRAEQQHHRRDR